jgi:fructose-bisphosphate aldolase/6-deoxy-5-ketofructose 1-phosphate synthase
MRAEKKHIDIPLDVPETAHDEYRKNFHAITHGTGRLMLFAGDQKVEHLNDDFYGPGIHSDDGDAEHLFRIASRAKIGVFAAQMGLIARYGKDYKTVPYLVKLNSKTHLVKAEQRDPVSSAWYTIPHVVTFKKQTGLSILAIGYTIYLGSEYEDGMLREAAQLIRQAHECGLVTVLWIYPRGKGVKDEKDPHLIAGACGVAACLGSDFVKVNAPKRNGESPARLLQEGVRAAGRTRVVCAGGSSVDPEAFLHELYEQIHIGGAAGNATGRNIHQRSLPEATRMCNAIYAVTIENADVATAMKLYQSQGL